MFLQYYRENAEYLERTYDFLERVGIVACAPRRSTHRTRRGPVARPLRSLARGRRGAVVEGGPAPATPHQFGSLAAVTAPTSGEAVRVAVLDELPLGEGRSVRVGAREIALFRTGTREVRAIAARCPHANGPLADGIVAGTKVTCPLHGWRFDLATGEGTSPGGNCEGIPVYAIELRRDEVWLSLARHSELAR